MSLCGIPFATTYEIILYLYMRFKFLLIPAIMLLSFYSFTGCRSQVKKTKEDKKPNEETKEWKTKSLPSKEYDLDNPTIVKLPSQLNEISGLSF